jgi:hypothetical protein
MTKGELESIGMCIGGAALFIVISFGLIFLYVPPEYNKFGGDKYKKWEYKLAPSTPVKNGADFEIQKTILDGFGEQGWEYAGFIDQPPQPYIIFKRPVSK